MSITFTKLFSSITESTVWCEPDRTRLVWICMLAMADRNGRVWASIPGLANRARVPLEDAKLAIATFLGPDEYSRTPDNEGRRIEPIDGGWRLLNHEKYRSIRDEETTKEAKRNYINKRRAAEREAKPSTVEQVSNTVERGRDNAEADTEADTGSVPIGTGGKPPMLTDPKEIIFGYGLSMLVNAGTPEKQARSFLGGLAKHHGEPELIAKLRECAKARPLQPLEWLAAALPPNGPKPKLNKQEALEASNREVARRFIEKLESEHEQE